MVKRCGWRGEAGLAQPFNLMLFTADKLTFGIDPARLALGPPGDCQNAGRQIMFMSLKMLIQGNEVSIVR